jgi:hypothetical protein
MTNAEKTHCSGMNVEPRYRIRTKNFVEAGRNCVSADKRLASMHNRLHRSENPRYSSN